MARDQRFSRMGSSTTLLQIHVSEDSNYALVPVIVAPVPIRGWKIYDAVAGKLLETSVEPADFPAEGLFSTLYEAREWLLANRYPQA